MPLTLVTLEESLHPEILTQPCGEVSFPLSKEDQNLVNDMVAFLDEIRGVGLAAPQIGVSKQIFVLKISGDAKALREDADETIDSMILINADYKAAPDAKIVHDWEACFSVRNTVGKVPRFNKIIYSGTTLEGKKIETTASGFTARVIQHEIDHLKGILITHRLTPDCVQGNPQEMQALRLKEMTPEQQAIAQKIIAERDAKK